MQHQLLHNNFNSIKVRLEPYDGNDVQDLSRNFNSIKVRLELTFLQHKTMILKFQFHKGTIRTMSSPVR